MDSHKLSLTADHVRLVTRVVERPAERTDLHLTPISDADLAAYATRLALDCEGRPLWLFVYGSLLWNPAFDHVERRRAVVHGWRRAFCLSIRNYRATPQAPGLMLALARGGSCLGAVFRLPDDTREGRILTLLRREIAYREDLQAVRWVNARTSEGTVSALAFYCAHSADADYVYLPEDEQARRLATAVGYAGSCAEYLYNTVVHFADLGIRDTYLWRMQVRVAREIDGMFEGLDAGTPLSGAGGDLA
jgi:glutathione-specific gamma-glutamylcyclotransferase